MYRVETPPPGGNPVAPAGVGASPWSLPFGQVPGLEAGAGRKRLATFQPASEHINTLLRNAGNTATARARWLVRNNGYARSALRSWTTATVGAGIKPSSLIADPVLKQAVARVFLDWTDEADSEGMTDFYGLARRVTRETFIAGECFVRLITPPADDGLAIPLQLLLLPSEQLPLWRQEAAPNGNPIRLGIEHNQRGKREAYWFWRSNPSDVTLSFSDALASQQLMRVPAAEILHVFDPVEAGQLRGLTGFAAAVVKMFLLDVYDDAELERKKQAARFATFIKRDVPDFAGDTEWAREYYTALGAQSDDDSPLIGHYGPGATVELSEGDDVRFSEPADVGPNYEPFQFRTLLQVFSGIGIPYSEGSGDLSRTSYASSRAGLLPFRAEIEAFQHAVLVYQFLRPVWHRFWQAGVLSGALPVTPARYNRERKELVRYKAIVPRTPWVDPLKDRQAEKLAVDSGFKARSDVIEAEGYDPEEVDQRIAEDKAREERLGLSFAPAQHVTVPEPAAQPVRQAA